jgi:hypothetical protein
MTQTTTLPDQTAKRELLASILWLNRYGHRWEGATWDDAVADAKLCPGGQPDAEVTECRSDADALLASQPADQTRQGEP